MGFSFHGASLDAISIGGEAVFRKGIGPLLPGTEHAPPCDPARVPASAAAASCNAQCAEYLDYVLGKEEDIGAVIIETVRCDRRPDSAARVLPDRARRLRPPRRAADPRTKCRSASAALGRMFAFEHYGIVPDMVVLGKGLGGAVFPMAALIARRDLDIAADRALGHYTHEKSSVGQRRRACDARSDRERKAARARADAGRACACANARVQQRHPMVADVRGDRLACSAIELARDGVPARREAETA